MFYGHAMLIGGKPERIEIFIVSGLSLSRPVDTKTDLKLNNIIATPSSNLILTPLDECQSWLAITKEPIMLSLIVQNLPTRWTSVALYSVVAYSLFSNSP